MFIKQFFVRWISIVPFVVLLAATSAWGAEWDRDIERTFKVKPGGLLSLDSDLGYIDVETAPGNTLKVRIIRDPDARNRKEAKKLVENFRVHFDHNGKDVSIEGKYSGSWWRKNRNLNVGFIITVPEKYNVNLMTSGGSIKVEDLEGNVDVNTAGGSLKFGNINGALKGKTAGGSISLRSCTGKVDVHTSGGSINIGNVEANVNAHTAGGSIRIDRAKGNVVAETSGGSIAVEEVMGSIEASTSGGSITATISEQPENDCSLTTSAGSVTIYLAKNVSVDLNAKSSWGKVQTDFPVKGKFQSDDDDSYLKGKINGGGPQLYLRTSAGKIKIRKMP